MDNKNRVVVLLNNYVKIYGSIDFGTILKQLLKEFVDLGQYPNNIKPHTELAEEIHKYLAANGVYTAIEADEREFRLTIGYWKIPLSMATYDAGAGRHVMIPDTPWLVQVVPKEPPSHKQSVDD